MLSQEDLVVGVWVGGVWESAKFCWQTKLLGEKGKTLRQQPGPQFCPRIKNNPKPVLNNNSNIAAIVWNLFHGFTFASLFIVASVDWKWFTAKKIKSQAKITNTQVAFCYMILRISTGAVERNSLQKSSFFNLAVNIYLKIEGNFIFVCIIEEVWQKIQHVTINYRNCESMWSIFWFISLLPHKT